jgi:membrane protease YdiL (CAAX protease family)
MFGRKPNLERKIKEVLPLALATTTNSSTKTETSDEKLKLAAGLVGTIWGAGLFGHFTKAKEWPALFIYGLGAIGLTSYVAKRDGWDKTNLGKENLKKALIWGGAIGSGLFLSDVSNTYAYFKKGGAPMAEMEDILVRQKFLYLFPVLIVSEEFLWRGLLFSALQEKGLNGHKIVGLTTLAYVLNHYAVAPVKFRERSLMAGMAVPIGIANGYLTLKTKNAWGGVLLHMLTMISMMADMFIIPKMVKKAKKSRATITI